jgi:glycosyltransferase involved in cell wall biosynthesis
MKPSISIIIPAVNEEHDLKPTVETALEAIGDKFSDYEILIFNDGSRDKTGEIADQLANNNPHIQVIHHSRNMGLGYNFRTGVELATKEYVGWIPAKNSIPLETLNNMFDAVGKADIVLVFILTETRSMFRQIVSRVFTRMMNTLFGMNLKYFNGPNIFKSKLVKKTKMTTNGFAYMAEILIRLIKNGHTYVEVGLHNRDRQNGNSKAFVFRNFVRVVKVIIRLFWEIQIIGTFKEKFLAKHRPISVDSQVEQPGKQSTTIVELN